MQKVFDEIREKLNGFSYQDEDALGYEQNTIDLEDAMLAIDEVASKYAQCALCYIASPCEYQNPDVKIEEKDNWIPVEEALPEYLGDDNCSADVLVSILDERDPERRTSTCAGYYQDGKWYTYMNHGYEEVGSRRIFEDKVVAWQHMPADYVVKEKK